MNGIWGFADQDKRDWTTRHENDQRTEFVRRNMVFREHGLEPPPYYVPTRHERWAARELRLAARSLKRGLTGETLVKRERPEG